ncbi:hypothetical protein EHQ58_12235 [Leptospira ognonensis]|uniref:Uncharacterized protein n=1 Tax=Leptospira ognonensis TaxID=2484945 RepID=A0A4V6QM44_9LEPT|nr:hypothetical protein [Leptospira ognonensis]TGL58143.1 hypothetical protein EHQ58_12235 [Leptospira ognonensis]
MVLSTFLSDFLLSFVSFYMAYRFKGLSSISARAALYAFAIIGISAGLGSIHFLGIHTLDPIYRFFVGLSGCVGVPLLGVSFFHFGFKALTEKLFFFKIAALFVIFLLITYFYAVPIYPTLVGAISMLIIIIVSIQKFSREKSGAFYGFAGAILFILAGLVIGTSGSRGGILNVDIFHVMLAIANFCLGNAILRLK